VRGNIIENKFDGALEHFVFGFQQDAEAIVVVVNKISRRIAGGILNPK
jgi:hypothetical protein